MLGTYLPPSNAAAYLFQEESEEMESDAGGEERKVTLAQHYSYPNLVLPELVKLSTGIHYSECRLDLQE